MTTAAQPPASDLLPALFCGEPHPLVPELLCARLSGHFGTHQSDGQDAWADTRPDTTGEAR